jgi:hypothetical protein
MMVPDHRAGTVLRCPNCGIDVQVPGEPSGPTKGLGQARLKPPIAGRSPTIPAISGAGEQSPQVAGHSTAAKSGIGQTPGARPSSKPRLKPPPSPAKVSPPVKAEQPAPIEAPPVVPSEPIAASASPVTPEPGIQWKDEKQKSAHPPSTTPKDAGIIFAEMQMRPGKAATSVEPPSAKQKPAASKRWQEEPVQPAPPKPSSPVPNRPRTTLTGTMLAPETSFEEPEPPLPLIKPRPIKPPIESPAPPVVAKAEPAVVPPPIVEPEFVPPEIVAQAEAKVSFHSAATQVEPHRPLSTLSPAPPVVVTLGVAPTPSQRVTVWQLAAALLAVAIMSIGPSIWEIGDYLGSDGEQSVARWAFLLLMLGVVQVGCLFLLIQVPDWSSVWIVTIQSLVLAAIYAAVLGLTVITGGDSTLISALQLEFQYASGKAPLWCVCLAATYASLAFFAGRFSAKWRKVLRQLQASDEAAYAH